MITLPPETAMPPQPAARYVSPPGEIVGAPPYRASGCLMQGWFLPGRQAAQQAFVDAMLNVPAAGAMTFRAVTDQVLMTAIYADTMASLDPVDSQKGVTQEWDVAFWTAVLGGPPGQDDQQRAYWLPSFMFVDSTWAMASGREIYGYPKSVGSFADRVADRDDPTVTISAAHFPRFAPDQRPVTEPLVRVRLGQTPSVLSELVDDAAAAWGVLGGLTYEAGGFHLPPWPGLCMPQILLRQARDPVSFALANPQSIVCVAPRPVDIKGVGLLKGAIEVELTASASCPIGPTLGLAAQSRGHLGFWVAQDFDVGPAEVLV